MHTVCVTLTGLQDIKIAIAAVKYFCTFQFLKRITDYLDLKAKSLPSFEIWNKKGPILKHNSNVLYTSNQMKLA